ncbi:hypothetical protein Tco_0351519 [Tanacetum coccineum]
MEECHRLLTNKIDLMNLEGHRVVPDVSKPLPLVGPPVAHYLDFRLEELVPSLWIESECDYDISASYGITHWWFKWKEFYIQRHSAPSNHHAVRSYMWILSVTSLKTYERYGYTYLREIVLRRADYNEYKKSEANFKNLHPNDFEDLYLLHLQGKLNHIPGSNKVHLFNAINMWIRNIIIKQRVADLQLDIESYQTKLNLIQPSWDASDFLFKDDYTIVSKPRTLDHMVKDFKLFKYNPGIEARIWSEDDKRRCKEFMENIRVIPKYHSKDGNTARANIKQALSRDGDGDTLFQQSQVHNRMLTLDQHLCRNHESSSKGFNASANSDINFFLNMSNTQDGEGSQDDDQRLRLADDLKKAQDQIQ